MGGGGGGLGRSEVKLSKHEFIKKFTRFYLVSAKFYQILLSVTSSGTRFYQIPLAAVAKAWHIDVIMGLCLRKYSDCCTHSLHAFTMLANCLFMTASQGTLTQILHTHYYTGLQDPRRIDIFPMLWGYISHIPPWMPCTHTSVQASPVPPLVPAPHQQICEFPAGETLAANLQHVLAIHRNLTLTTCVRDRLPKPCLFFKPVPSLRCSNKCLPAVQANTGLRQRVTHCSISDHLCVEHLFYTPAHPPRIYLKQSSCCTAMCICHLLGKDSAPGVDIIVTTFPR